MSAAAVRVLRTLGAGCAFGLALVAAGCASPSDPCEPNPCTDPPANTCMGTRAQIYPRLGQCQPSGGEAVCTYVPVETDCADTGLLCSAGQCVADPCDPNPCTSGPADACDGDVLVSYVDTGSCEVVDGQADCSYAEATRIDCAASGLACVGGTCQSTADPCSPNPCTAPPADFCTGQTASVYPSVGVCSNNGGTAECTYTPVEVDCTQTGQICQGGLCVTPGDPCSPNPCTAPPADDCTGDTANHYPNTGTCTDSGGTAQCTYTPTPEDCAASGKVCLAGSCVTPSLGGIFISEYVEGSGNNKYLEIFNGGTSGVDLAGYQVRIYSNGASSATATITLNSVVLAPGSVYVVGNPQGTLYTPDQTSGSLSFNGNDAVELVDPGQSRLDLLGVIGDASVYAQDVTLVRKSGIVSGSQTFDSAQWDSLATDAHQLGSHTP